MPTGFCDCFGFGAWIRNNDGKFAPVDLSQTVTMSPDPDESDEHYEGLTWEYKPMEFTATIRLPHKVQIEVSRRMRKVIKLLRRYNNVVRRLIRTEKRQAEQERRRRLKEGQHEQ